MRVCSSKGAPCTYAPSDDISGTSLSNWVILGLTKKIYYHVVEENGLSALGVPKNDVSSEEPNELPSLLDMRNRQVRKIPSLWASLS